MKKFYLSMLAVLGLAGISLAVAGSHDLNIEKATLKTDIQVQKVNKTVALKGAQTVEKSLDKGAMKQVRSIRKADGNESIEGIWIFSFGDYYFQSSVNGTIEYEIEAQIQEGMVVFQEEQGAVPPFVASYNEATGTLTFEKMFLATQTQYYMYQEPFEYDYGLQDIVNINSLVGNFDAATGTITFLSDQGLAWTAYTNQAGSGQPAGYFGIYDFEGAEKSMNWITMEDATFNENIIYGTFTREENKKVSPVVVEQNPLNPGIFRVKNPFAELYNALEIDAVSPTMTIDASDPENVLLEMQATGLASMERAPYYYFNEGWYCNEYPEYGALDPALACTMTTDADGYTVITFPYQSCTVFLATQEPQFYYGSAYESVLRFKMPSSAQKVGTYTMDIIPTDLFGSKEAAPAEMTVSVYTEDEVNYWIEEERTSNYLKGYKVPFKFSEPNSAIFETTYLGEDESFGANEDAPYLWVSAFVGEGGIAEPQPMFMATFNPESGFEFIPNSGIAIYNSDSETVFTPYDMFTGFYVGDNEVEVDYGNKAIVGDWVFSINGAYTGTESLGEKDMAYKATLSGNLVYFQDEWDEFNMIAKFTDTNVLTFFRAPIGTPAKYTLTQNPFTSTTGDNIDDDEKFVFESFTATFDPDEGTLTFPEGAGMAFGYANEAGEFQYYTEAFDLISAYKGVPATLTIGNVSIKERQDAEGVYQNVSVIVESENLPEDAEISLFYTMNKEEYTEVKGTGELFTFKIYNLDINTDYILTMYAKSGNTVSPEKEVIFTTSGVKAIEDAADSRYFNLQGVEVKNPQPGELLIRINGNKASKVIVK